MATLAHSGLEQASRWFPCEFGPAIPDYVISHVVRIGIPRANVTKIQPSESASGYLSFHVHLDREPWMVRVRIYDRDWGPCRKQIELLRLLGGCAPVPEIIHAQAEADGIVPPFLITRFVDGISLHDLRRSGDAASASGAAFAIGQALAGLSRMKFSKSGWLTPGLHIESVEIEGPDRIPRFVDSCLASDQLQIHLDEGLRERVHKLAWWWCTELAQMDAESTLVHGNFAKSNILLQKKDGRWAVAAIMNWEAARAGSPLADIGRFLRLERAAQPFAEPHFSNGYLQAGGTLPVDWRFVSRIADLVSLLKDLALGNLSREAALQAVALIRGTLDDRDPVFA